VIEFRKILLPVDFSPLSELAARYVARLADAFGSRVHVLHVVPTETLVATLPEQGSSFVTSPQQRIAETERQLDRFVAEHLPRPLVDKRSVCGTPAPEIAREAREVGADLIVMGTHAEGVVRRLVFGSVSKSVLESAPCAVLLVPLATASPE
jgi:nucleotide-binding universal stress UspA family protein